MNQRINTTTIVAITNIKHAFKVFCKTKVKKI